MFREEGKNLTSDPFLFVQLTFLMRQKSHASLEYFILRRMLPRNFQLCHPGQTLPPNFGEKTFLPERDLPGTRGDNAAPSVYHEFAGVGEHLNALHSGGSNVFRWPVTWGDDL